jgi:dienelactone hydrolase
MLAILLLAALPAFAQSDLESLLGKTLLDPNQPLLDVQVYTATKIPVVPTFQTRQQWETYASRLRQKVLDEIVYRGEARPWRSAKTRVEIRPPFHEGNGYRVRHLLFETIPGLWVPGLIYEPEKVSGRVPVVLNVNGHEGNGTATPYIQARCINLAKKGLIAVNPEWLGRGQLRVPGMDHSRMPQLDLTGTSGLALFYLSLKRSLDAALSLPHADASRVAVTGLSGGGWQTIILSSLDTRVAVANPVAGYSSYVTRAQWPELDLGDSEQTPSDLASVADYAHLTALMAPRGLQVANNAKDNCCFRAEYATAPLIQIATPVYRLYNALDRVRYHTNHGNGHNYDEDNREAFYRLLRDHFRLKIDVTDVNVESEIRQDTQLRPDLPADNLDFHQIALRLSQGLPRNPAPGRAKLAELVRYQPLAVEAFRAGDGQQGAVKATYWKLNMGRAWNVPVTELEPAGAKATVLMVADAGRAKQAASIRQLIEAGTRVVAMDPFYFGESKIAKRDYLFALLLAGIGDRPLGLQASQVAAAARWLERDRKLGAVRVHAAGPRSSLFALVAGAIETQSISGLSLQGALGSLREVLERDWTVNQYPEMFCFGLLEHFDVPHIEALVAPRPVLKSGS